MGRPKKHSRKQSARVKRPELPRTEPLRSWSTLFGSPNGGSASGSRSAAGAGPTGDPVRRGVELGYRVIDEYVRQGAAAANAFAGPGRARAMSSEDLPKMTERMMQYASDITSLWFDAMGLMMGNRDDRSAASSGRDAKAAAAPADVASSSPARSRLSVDVKSAQGAQVILTLDDPLSGPVVVEPLRERSGRSEISDVSLELPTEPGAALKVRVHVPSRQRPGRYSGAVLETKSRRPRGRLTVTIGK